MNKVKLEFQSQSSINERINFKTSGLMIVQDEIVELQYQEPNSDNEFVNVVMTYDGETLILVRKGNADSKFVFNKTKGCSAIYYYQNLKVALDINLLKMEFNLQKIILEYEIKHDQQNKDWFKIEMFIEEEVNN